MWRLPANRTLPATCEEKKVKAVEVDENGDKPVGAALSRESGRYDSLLMKIKGPVARADPNKKGSTQQCATTYSGTTQPSIPLPSLSFWNDPGSESAAQGPTARCVKDVPA